MEAGSPPAPKVAPDCRHLASQVILDMSNIVYLVRTIISFRPSFVFIPIVTTLQKRIPPSDLSNPYHPTTVKTLSNMHAPKTHTTGHNPHGYSIFINNPQFKVFSPHSGIIYSTESGDPVNLEHNADLIAHEVGGHDSLVPKQGSVVVTMEWPPGAYVEDLRSLSVSVGVMVQGQSTSSDSSSWNMRNHMTSYHFPTLSFAPTCTPLAISEADVFFGLVMCMLDSGDSRIVKKGEVIIQRGTMHAWKNTSGKLAKMVFFVLPSQPVQAADGDLMKLSIEPSEVAV